MLTKTYTPQWGNIPTMETIVVASFWGSESPEKGSLTEQPKYSTELLHGLCCCVNNSCESIITTDRLWLITGG
jgi:hypothetical protein